MDRLTLCILALLAVTPAWAADAPATAFTVVITSDEVNVAGPATRVMQEELAALWMRYGVTVWWPQRGSTPPPASFFVKLMMVDGPLDSKGRPLGAVYRAGPTFRRLIAVSSRASSRTSSVTCCCRRRGTLPRG
jgi:hypothetical protein